MTDARFRLGLAHSQDSGTPDHDADNAASAGLSRRDFIAAGSAGLAAAAFAREALAAPLLDGREGSDRDKREPLILERQGSFAFGGTVVTGTNGDTFHGDHGYVQFQIPPNARNLPLVMWHGGGQMGKTWESTPDGRDGYQTIFVRRGFSTYIIDQPRRGRAYWPRPSALLSR